MAIDNVNVIDGIGIDREGKILRLLMTGHFCWGFIQYGLSRALVSIGILHRILKKLRLLLIT